MDENTLQQLVKDVTDLKERMAIAEKFAKKYRAERDNVTARNDMKQDGKIDDIQQISKEMAAQIITSFNENYDARMIQNIEQTRKTAPTHKDVTRYDKQKSLVAQLKERYNL